MSASKPWSCGGCDTMWGGLDLAHCASCHETFTTVRNFDTHRSKGKCVFTGLIRGTRGYWMEPGPPSPVQQNVPESIGT